MDQLSKSQKLFLLNCWTDRKSVQSFNVSNGILNVDPGPVCSVASPTGKQIAAFVPCQQLPQVQTN